MSYENSGKLAQFGIFAEIHELEECKEVTKTIN